MSAAWPTAPDTGVGPFTGARVLVTGGTSGIGAATADLLARHGADVVALGLPPARADLLPGHPGVRVVEHDVTDRGGLHGQVAGQGRLDALVNCAGLSRDRGEYEREHWDRVLEVNLTAAMVASTAARRGLEGAGGVIVNVSSMFAVFGSGDRPAYSASKGGVSQLTRSLAIEYAAQGIRVNAVAPGFVATPLARGVLDDPQARAVTLARIPLGRVGTASEIADVIAFLCSPAAAYVNGAVIPVDGGYSVA